MNINKALLKYLGNKWTAEVLTTLYNSDTPIRFGDLIDGAIAINGHKISGRVLSVTLKQGEVLGLIQRESLRTTPPCVNYELTRAGRLVLRHLLKLTDELAQEIWETIE